jgi:hypothetical protein
MKSILQKEKQCLVCGNTQVEEHHVIYGTANRKLSEKYGLKVWLCNKHHTASLYLDKSTAVHFNKVFDEKLKKMAQRKFEEVYPELDFLKVFGRNYL